MGMRGIVTIAGCLVVLAWCIAKAQPGSVAPRSDALRPGAESKSSPSPHADIASRVTPADEVADTPVREPAVALGEECGDMLPSDEATQGTLDQACRGATAQRLTRSASPRHCRIGCGGVRAAFRLGVAGEPALPVLWTDGGFAHEIGRGPVEFCEHDALADADPVAMEWVKRAIRGGRRSFTEYRSRGTARCWPGPRRSRRQHRSRQRASAGRT
jgi:hypothetical protein